MVNAARHAEGLPPCTRRSCRSNGSQSRLSVPKFIPAQLIAPIEKAPQNAKYSVLRGVIMPAAGVEPAQNISIIMHFAVRANFRAKPIKKRAEHTPRPYEKSVHAVTFSSHIMNNIRPRDIINDACCIDAVGLLEFNDLTQRLPTKVPIDCQAAESKLDPFDCDAFGTAF